MYAIILAGGAGSRLWPRSRNKTPKQLLGLLGEESLLQATAARLAPLAPLDHVIVVTGDAHAAQVRAQLPDLPPANVLVEPAPRGTAPAIGLALLHIERLAAARGEADPVIGSFHADHVITRPAAFQAVVREAAAAAGGGYLVTLGITPDQPHTGYGYIERGEPLPSAGDYPVYRVARFVEKPPRATAEGYVATGLYSWNSGMFLWQLSTILQEYARHQPGLLAQLRKIGAALGTPALDGTLGRVWPGIRTETIDVGIAEKSERMAVIPADFGWSDVGDWAVVADLLAAAQHDPQQNAVLGAHLGLDTVHSLVYGSVPGKLIATIGLDNIVIVDTPDVLLVCDRTRNQDVKKVVQALKAQGLERYL